MQRTTSPDFTAGGVITPETARSVTRALEAKLRGRPRDLTFPELVMPDELTALEVAIEQGLSVSR